MSALKTWREVLSLASDYLASHQVPDPTVAAELLVARLLACGRGFLTPHLEKPVSAPHLEAMRRGMKRLVNNEPIQYVLGEWDFRSLTLTCDQRGLIPRPETEELVTLVLKFLNDTPSSQPRFIVDVGTGSGCILLALAHEYQGQASYLGLDISPDAISLAQENAVRCGLQDKVHFAVTDGLDEFDTPASMDVIVSNPPYIPSRICDQLDERVRKEPRLALDGGAEGLDFYERFISDAWHLLRPGGAIFFEIGDEQGQAVRKLLFDAGFQSIEVLRDWAGHDRYVSAQLLS